MRRDGLGDRMKAQYEDRMRIMLPRRTFTVIRVDGKAFHTFTRGCDRPYDRGISDAMSAAALALCEEAQGAKLALVQSDEISVVLTDFDRIETQAWFDGNLQKIVSVASSVVTAAFNAAYPTKPRATFDARVFTIPDATEVENYFIWRQKDAVRNSVSVLAQCHFSAKQLHEKDQEQMHEMLRGIGIVWADVTPPAFQRGWCYVRERGNGWMMDVPPMFTDDPTREYLRAQWRIDDTPTEPSAKELPPAIRRCAYVISNHSRDSSPIQCRREDIYHRPLDPSSNIAHAFVASTDQPEPEHG